MKVSISGTQPQDGSADTSHSGEGEPLAAFPGGTGITLHRPETLPLPLASMNQDTDGNNRPGEFIGPLSQSTLGEKQVEDQWGPGKGVVSNGLVGRGLKGRWRCGMETSWLAG